MIPRVFSLGKKALDQLELLLDRRPVADPGDVAAGTLVVLHQARPPLGSVTAPKTIGFFLVALARAWEDGVVIPKRTWFWLLTSFYAMVFRLLWSLLAFW